MGFRSDLSKSHWEKTPLAWQAIRGCTFPPMDVGVLHTVLIPRESTHVATDCRPFSLLSVLDCEDMTWSLKGLPWLA